MDRTYINDLFFIDFPQLFYNLFVLLVSELGYNWIQDPVSFLSDRRMRNSLHISVLVGISGTFLSLVLDS